MPQTRILSRLSGFICWLIVAQVVIGCIRPEPTAPQATTPAQAETQAERTTATQSETVSDTTTVVETNTTSSAPAAEVKLVASDEYNGIPVGFTAEGYPFRGSPEAAVTMYEFSDFQCPFCQRYFVQTEPAINESFVRTGKLRVVFRDFPLASIHSNAPAAHEAANCVAAQGIALYWAMHDQLFRSQNEWAGLEDPQTVFTRLVDETGADSDLYEECVTSGAARAQIERSVAEAQNLGFSGTPSFRFVNPALPDAYNLIGAQPYEQFANYIEAIAAGSPPAANQQAQQEGDGDIPVWATSEGLKANPDQPGRTVTGDEYLGDLEASVVVIEFSDFQCPYCSKHVAETEPTLRKTFIEDGRVLWVFKHFPLTNIHPQAFAASVAAECAGDQGKFWEMHDKLFSDPSLWSIEEPNPIFTGFAAELKLEDAAFTNCLASDDAKQRVQNDIDEGARFIQGTPSFIVLKDGTGRIIPGALPTEQFVAALEGVIANGFQ